MSGSSNDFFDFNHDGKLDALEWSAKMEFWDEVSKDRSEYYGQMANSSQKRKAGSGSQAKKTAGSGRPARSTTGASAGSGTEQAEIIEIHPAFWVFLKMILGLICFFLVYYAYLGIKHDIDAEREVGKVESSLEEYEKLVSEKLPAYCGKRGIGINGTYTAEGFPELTKSPGSGKEYQFYKIKLDYAVTLHVGEYFDRRDDRIKLEYLEALYKMADEAHEEFMKKSFPEYSDLYGWEPVEKVFFSFENVVREVYIQTPAHLYQYSRMYDDLYILDGEDYFLQDEQSRWRK